jgi:hypothetical protein
MAVAVGALLAVFPMTIALTKFGSRFIFIKLIVLLTNKKFRMVFGVLGFVSAFSTLLIPLSANIGYPMMVSLPFNRCV